MTNEEIEQWIDKYVSIREEQGTPMPLKRCMFASAYRVRQRVRDEIILKTCEWLQTHIWDYEESPEGELNVEKMINDFKKAIGYE